MSTLRKTCDELKAEAQQFEEQAMNVSWMLGYKIGNCARILG